MQIKSTKWNVVKEGNGPPQRIAELELNKQILENKAKSSEIALITIGRNAGENADRNVENDFNLAIDEINLMMNVAAFSCSRQKSSCCSKHRWCYRNGKLEK
jgi:hypothetical protein